MVKGSKVEVYLENIKKKNKELNAFFEVNENIKDVKSSGSLSGYVMGVKSNISVNGMEVNCGSKTLEGFKGLFDADVISKLKMEGCGIIGMVNCDEFGCGSTGENCSFGQVKNPLAKDKIPGGSSSGSAVSVAADMCDFALGSDTGGSVRNPASHCGVVGLKPSYGRVSRYGLVDLSMSLESIGILAKNVFDCAKVLGVIAGRSERDATTKDVPVPDYTKNLKSFKNKKIGVIKEVKGLCENKKVYDLVMKSVEEFAKKTNSTVVEVSVKNLDLAVKAYYPIVYTEFFSATRKFDGRKYGKVIEKSCGEEVLTRILGGKEISKAEYEGRYYNKALSVRKIISEEFKKCFESVDVICSPVTPDIAHTIGESKSLESNYASDVFTCPVNLSGDCAGVVNCGNIDGLPVGLQFICPAFKEDALLSSMFAFNEK